MGVTGYDPFTGTFTPQEGDSVWNQLEVSDLGICQQSDCHNGILVNGPGEGVPLNAPHVSDDQVLECLWNHSTGGDTLQTGLQREICLETLPSSVRAVH